MAELAAAAAADDPGREKDCVNAFDCCAPVGDWMAKPVSTELVSWVGGDSNSTLVQLSKLMHKYINKYFNC